MSTTHPASVNTSWTTATENHGGGDGGAGNHPASFTPSSTTPTHSHPAPLEHISGIERCKLSASAPSYSLPNRRSLQAGLQRPTVHALSTPSRSVTAAAAAAAAACTTRAAAASCQCSTCGAVGGGGRSARSARSRFATSGRLSGDGMSTVRVARGKSRRRPRQQLGKAILPAIDTG